MATNAHNETVAARDACDELERAVVVLTEEGRERYDALAHVATELMHSRCVFCTRYLSQSRERKLPVKKYFILVVRAAKSGHYIIT